MSTWQIGVTVAVFAFLVGTVIERLGKIRDEARQTNRLLEEINKRMAGLK